VKRCAARVGRALLLFVLIVAAAAGAAAQPRFPALSGRVVDEAGVLSAGTRAALTHLFEAHERATTNQVVVATVASLQGYEIADFGVRLGRAWKIGQGDRNNGTILLVAPNERQVRIEVGYGLEGSLPDALAFQIIQVEILPRFQAGDTDGSYKARPVAPGLLNHPAVARLLNNPEFLFLLMFGAAILLVALLERYNSWRLGPNYRRLRRPRYRDDSSSGGWSVGGGRSSGGGFGGGGGSFGGGGASGRW
jgi:uncharacterized protein